MIKPSQLVPGDTVAMISLSSGAAHTFYHRYLIGKQQRQATLGLQVIETRYALNDEAALLDRVG